MIPRKYLLSVLPWLGAVRAQASVFPSTVDIITAVTVTSVSESVGASDAVFTTTSLRVNPTTITTTVAGVETVTTSFGPSITDTITYTSAQLFTAKSTVTYIGVSIIGTSIITGPGSATNGAAASTSTGSPRPFVTSGANSTVSHSGSPSRTIDSSSLSHLLYPTGGSANSTSNPNGVNQSSQQGGLTPGTKAAIGIGAVLALLLLGVLAYYGRKFFALRKEGHPKGKHSDPEGGGLFSSAYERLDNNANAMAETRDIQSRRMNEAEFDMYNQRLSRMSPMGMPHDSDTEDEHNMYVGVPPHSIKMKQFLDTGSDRDSRSSRTAYDSRSVS